MSKIRFHCSVRFHCSGGSGGGLFIQLYCCHYRYFEAKLKIYEDCIYFVSGKYGNNVEQVKQYDYNDSKFNEEDFLICKDCKELIVSNEELKRIISLYNLAGYVGVYNYLSSLYEVNGVYY